ncbi:MAG: protease HtpX, partial [Pseudomonadales bacterium]|nr:protease HtpX [Pseudomonadales bacterium]
MFKRVALFIITNLAVIFMLSIVLHLVFAYFQIDNQGITPLLIFSFIFGMGGSFISLAMSKWIAKMSTGAKVIEKASNSMESWLLETVKRQARDAGIGMPEVAVYESPDINAFATGMNKNSALVAVSSGLLNSMSRDEAEAVLGHEVSHIANGDMVTLTLLQGVLNTFVIFFSRIAAMAVNNALRNNNEQMGAFTYFIVVMVFQVIFGAI